MATAHIKVVLRFGSTAARDAFSDRLPGDFSDTHVDPAMELDGTPVLILQGRVGTRARADNVRDALRSRMDQADVLDGSRLVVHRCRHDTGQACDTVVRMLKSGGVTG